MPRYPWVLISLASFAVSAGCAQTVNVEQERTALMSADRDWSQTVKDPDKFVTFYVDGASMYPQGMPIVTGVDAIKKTYTEWTKAPGFALSFTATKADVAASGDIGYTAGTYEIAMGGATEKGKYVTTWKKQTDGKWKVTDDIFNADAPPPAPAATHVTVNANTIKWGDAPPGLPPGAHAAVIAGDPGKAEPFVIRAQMPAGYKIAPHWHGTTENLTVVSGTVAVGMGDAFDESKMESIPAGGFTAMPGEMHHFFMSKTAAIIQIHGMGPFSITYMNAADDPRTKKTN